jgi:hypothetical protein
LTFELAQIPPLAAARLLRALEFDETEDFQMLALEIKLALLAMIVCAAIEAAQFFEVF